MVCRADPVGFMLLLGIGCLACAQAASDPMQPGARVTTVEVTPANVTLSALDATQQFSVVAKDASGTPITGKSFNWETTNAGVLAVSGSGLGTAVTNGAATVSAAVDGVKGSAPVTVDQAVSTVQVTPAAPSVAVGATVQLSATTSDANGYAMTGSSVTWGTSAASVATVSASGLVSSVALGSATITATSDGQTGSVTVTVTGTGTNPTVYLSEGFEDTDLISRGWYDLVAPVVTTNEKHSGNSSLELQFMQGSTGPVGGGGRFLFTETESVYFSYWVKYSANWVGSGYNAHPHEFYFLTNEDTPYRGPAWTHLTLYVEHNYQQGGIPFVRVKDGRNIDVNNVNQDLTGVTEVRAALGCNGNLDAYNTTCYSIGGGNYNNGKQWSPGQVYFSDTPGPFYKNDWHHIEVFAQLNAIPNGRGVADGVIRYWYDGQLVIDRDDILLRTGAKASMRFNQLITGVYVGQGSPVTQTMWVDDMTVANLR